ncbi:hypothetical protein SBA1_820065 [Candidatus Sulfotelmatobacter kueseliae]|uniref:DUF4440 domain-containing protein n=1 Tax=Candidatus Sulfotelmatobacter kueseliae TaxID=2042962 RepID=A0A2U3L8M2_9BACT|nr:hypothetical protein SBA1_820065 [Candidatus Sulfotelmatobacter kueseliae]
MTQGGVTHDYKSMAQVSPLVGYNSATKQGGTAMEKTKLLAKVGLLGVMLFAAVALAVGQAPGDDSEAVRQVESRFHQAFVAGDAKTLDALLTPDFVWMHGDGAVWPKQQLLDLIRSGKLNYKRDEIDSVKIALYGSAAVVVGHDARERDTGEKLDYNYTTTYVKQSGEWHIALYHSSHCPCAKPPSIPK